MFAADGLMSRAWEYFFREISERVYPLGKEKQFSIKNAQSSAANIEGLKFDNRRYTQAIVEYLVQRVTTGTGATELIESGNFIVTYNPSAKTWNIDKHNINSPENSGVDFSINSDGQVQYTSTDISGDASISSLHFRVRTLSGKNVQYSAFNTR